MANDMKHKAPPKSKGHKIRAPKLPQSKPERSPLTDMKPSTPRPEVGPLSSGESHPA